MAATSRLWQLLTGPEGHQQKKLDVDSLECLATWLDTYAQRAGHFSDEQERQLAAFRRECAALLQENTTQ